MYTYTKYMTSACIHLSIYVHTYIYIHEHIYKRIKIHKYMTCTPIFISHLYDKHTYSRTFPCHKFIPFILPYHRYQIYTRT